MVAPVPVMSLGTLNMSLHCSIGMKHLAELLYRAACVHLHTAAVLCVCERLFVEAHRHAG